MLLYIISKLRHLILMLGSPNNVGGISFWEVVTGELTSALLQVAQLSMASPLPDNE